MPDIKPFDIKSVEIVPKIESNILIVDDIDCNLLLLELTLKEDNYKVTRASSGEEALEKLAQTPFDLVLLDVNMSGIDGFEVCERMQQDAQLSEIPVIFITANQDSENTVRGFEVGGVDYVGKPFMPEELLARVRTHLKLKKSQAALKQANEKLQYLNQDLEKSARTDALTGLPNRRDMSMRLDEECAHILQKKPTFSLAIADIDNFKHFNDTYGHDCGDFVLISLAQLLQKNCRQQDHIARWGGEEFLFLLPETTAKEAGIILDRLRKMVANEIYHYQDLHLQVNITLGVCQKDQRALHECLKIADDGLYAGKHYGKNRVMLPTKQGFESVVTTE